ncbi:MAG TPA: response regulator [Dyella sp.]|uniref:response regulator n=1 Tax=Dyella sp. TaxID=1869338 RepID=UPI002D78F7CB|nr:response regulator [Dyella sp.]HET6553963.1 response regulator [Dyella sp.]
MFNTPSSDPSRASGAPETVRALVADDDPTSRLFLVEALRSLGLDAQACNDGPAAIALAHDQPFDLLLLDCRMPGAGAEEVLTALRHDPGARSSDCTAVATSADMDASERQRLLSAEFSEVLQKPCNISDLRRILALVQAGAAALPLLDDAQAEATMGDAEVVKAMRALLRAELVGLYQDLDILRDDPSSFAERLHRLRSSCGFCGATALATQATLLQRHLKLGHSGSLAPLSRFRKALMATIEAVEAETG